MHGNIETNSLDDESQIEEVIIEKLDSPRKEKPKKEELPVEVNFFHFSTIFLYFTDK